MEFKRIAITTGDWDGVGSEVAAKALLQLGPKRNVQFILWRSPKCPKSHLALLDKKFERHTYSDLSSALRDTSTKSRTLVDICSLQPEPFWVLEAALACKNRLVDGLVTGPLDKNTIVESGLPDLGHTALLARVTSSKQLFMTFLGREFSLLLLTGHLPLHEVAPKLSKSLISAGLVAALNLRQRLPGPAKRRPVGLVGLNPHAGESGLIGSEEQKLFIPVVKSMQLQGLGVAGPLVPDVAYTPASRQRYSILVSPYHDQGLIPFKMIHGYDEGTHLTWGLPIVRTSVDHGTAKDIFNRNQAKPGSMREALLWAIRLTTKAGGQYGSKLRK